METIDGHTFDETLLSDGWVIDAGCRGFNFSDNLLIKQNKVFALDIEDLTIPDFIQLSSYSYNTEFKFKQAALTHYSGQTEAYFFGNGTGNFIKGINQTPGNSEDRPCETKTVPCITLQDIYKDIGTDIDLLKLDIEGAEYQILENFEPIPKQVTVEFHEHCHEKLHNTYINSVLERMCKHYHMHLFNCDPRYLFMDCLFIRKDIL